MLPPNAESSTFARLLSAPLPELLAEANAEIMDAPSELEAFEGVALRSPKGSIQVVLPKARSARFRDTMARRLVGQLLGADLLPMSALDVHTFGGAR
ncbi:hypothetical protein [Streptomyces sp. NPDC126503]|uniref:hypothetical protein n=1 Tax=Streptomyces sp. NPDC126503 TaxID=3155315 RepID=UPI00332B41F2